MQKQMGDSMRKVGDEGKDSVAKDWERWEGAQSTGILLILFVSGEKITRLFMLSMKEESVLVYKGEAVVCGRMSFMGILQSLRSLERRFCVVSLERAAVCSRAWLRGSGHTWTVLSPSASVFRSVVRVFPAFPVACGRGTCSFVSFWAGRSTTGRAVLTGGGEASDNSHSGGESLHSTAGRRLRGFA